MNYQRKLKKNSSINRVNDFGKKHVVVLAGGMSNEREISIKSGKRVVSSLLDLGYKVTSVDVGLDIALVISKLKADLIFNCLHGTFGEDGCISGLLNIMRIPYTHSGVMSSALSFNKVMTKQICKMHNINTPDFIIVNKYDKVEQDPIARPYVIKPIREGSSIGVNVILQEDSFSFSNYNFAYGDKVIVEKYVKGRELQVAVLNGKALGILEIQLLDRRFLDYESKYKKGLVKHLIPAPLIQNIYNNILDTAEKVFNILECKGIARVEFILDEKGDLFILEVNTHPGLTPLSIYPKITEHYSISFRDLCAHLVDSAVFEE